MRSTQPAVSPLARGVRFIGFATAYVLAIGIFWECLVQLLSIPRYILPPTSAVVGALIELPQYFLHHFSVTALEAILGLGLGASTGLAAGILLRFGGPAGRALNPLLLFSQTFPKEALAPLFIVVFGFGMFPKVLISGLISFFPLAIATYTGLKTTPIEAEQLMHVLGASTSQRFYYCQLPYAVPMITSALRVTATLSVIGAVVGEFVGASAGLGHVIRAANADIGTERIYAALLLLGALGASMYGLAVATENLVLRRWVRI